MKICLAQIRSETGQIERNIDHHLALLGALNLDLAADLVLFPELSLSNYAPEIAEAVAIEPTDSRLGQFVTFAERTGMAVAVGAPLRTSGRPLIAMLIFAPGVPRIIVGKRHLHTDEVPYFSPFEGNVGVLDLAKRVGVAICYEMSVAEHTQALISGGAEVYVASVAKTPAGAAEARMLISEMARRHGLPALMVNSVGTCEGKVAGGGSLAVDRAGLLLGELGDSTEGLLIYDTDTGSIRLLQNISIHIPERAQ